MRLPPVLSHGSSYRWSAVFLALLVGACAAPRGSPTSSSTQETVSTEDLNRLDNRIRPDDKVYIFVWRNPEASQMATVRSDGTIATPLLEDLPAEGKTPLQLAQDIEKVLEPYIRQAIVTVQVVHPGAPVSQQVQVVGAVKSPQIVPYRNDMRLLDLLYLVQGITGQAAGNDAVLLRIENGQQKQYPVRIDDLLKSADQAANVAIRPGDTLVVPSL